MGSAPLQAESAREALEKVLSSKSFASAERSSRLLRFMVESTVRGEADRLKEYTLGVEALGRAESFDPRIDSIARVEVSRLRNRLEQYYLVEGREDAVGIVLPRGTYVPVFEKRSPATDREPPIPTTSGSRRIHRLWFAAGGLAIGCVCAFYLWASWRPDRIPSKPTLQFDVRLSPGSFAYAGVGSDIALSPDGSALVFGNYRENGAVRLALRRLDQRTATDLPGTEGGRGPFFSPDGQWVGFWAAGKLKKVPLGGGSPIAICEATDLLGGSWGEDNNIVAALDSTGRLWRVPATGGKPVAILDLTGEALVPRWPQVLPGAKAILFTSTGNLGPDGGSIEVLSLDTGTRKTLVRGGTYGRYLRSGDLTYVNQDTLYATGFDLQHLEVRGSVVAELQDIAYSSTWGFAQLDFSKDGTLVYRRDPSGGQVTVQLLDANGHKSPLIGQPGRYEFPRFSPNNQRFAFSIADSGSSNIFVLDRERNGLTPLTSGDGIHMVPVWTPNGRFIVYEGTTGLWALASEGGSKPFRLTQSGSRQMPWSFTPDGKRLAFFEISPVTGFDLWTVEVQQDENLLKAGKPEPFLATPDFEIYPTFSPDGTWIAYGSNKSGRWEVYARAFPSGHRDVQISAGGARVPYWPKNGHEILYRTDDYRIVAVPYTKDGDSLRLGERRVWTEEHLASTGVLPNIDVTSDASHVAALLPAGDQVEAPGNEVTFLLNFADRVHLHTAARK